MKSLKCSVGCFVVMSNIIVSGLGVNSLTTDNNIIKIFPYKFTYANLDVLNMNVTLMNIPSNVTSAFLIMQLPRRKILRNFKIDQGQNSVLINRQFNEEGTVIIDVELNDSVLGTKQIVRISEGRQDGAEIKFNPFEKENLTNQESLDNRICFRNSESCILKLDLGNTDGNVSTVKNVIISFSFIFVLALVLLAIIAIRRRGRKTPDIATRPQMPLPHIPFYLNLLFRRECEQEIQENENGNIYEEIVSY